MSTVRLCGEEDRSNVIAYYATEPEVNLFALGDIEAFGMSYPVAIYAFERDDAESLSDAPHNAAPFDALLLKFYSNYMLYSKSTNYDVSAVAEFIRQDCGGELWGSILGRYTILRELAPFFPELDLRGMYMNRCDEVSQEALSDAPDYISIRLLEPHEYEQAMILLAHMEEYAGLLDSAQLREEAVARRLAEAEHGNFTYGAFDGEKLVAVSSTSAMNSTSAMLGSVGTASAYRQQGIATALVAATVQECFDRGKEFVCLFYDNPVAGNIYHQIGFNYVARFGMLR